MSGSTTTTLTPVLLQQIASKIFDSVYKYAGFYPFLPKRPGFTPGLNYTFDVKIAGNSSVQKFSSADPVPAAGYQQNLLITTSWQNYRVIIRLEGDARRAAGAAWDSPSWPGVVGGQNFEVQGGLEDLASYMAQDSWSTGTHGVDGQVNDDSVAFWDRSRVAYTTLKSAVVPAGGAYLSTAFLNQLLSETRGAGHGGNPMLLAMGDFQSQQLANAVSSQILAQQAGDISGMINGRPAPYGGCQPVIISGMAAAVVLALNPLDFEVINHEPTPGGVDVLEFGASSDAKTYQVVMSNVIVCNSPWKQGRLENLASS